ncbi:hypothetical protein CCHOA_08745 [Corynebacterium choanae]|uniref:Uncharacterized protein n=1 Tax=Corynebacterium choanae TaxID=1862358 RepID=A0A3G6J822_9CORY|nr:hypothetical protein CCHOA_08745 [Corynebacterium choanae]
MRRNAGNSLGILQGFGIARGVWLPRGQVHLCVGESVPRYKVSLSGLSEKSVRCVTGGGATVTNVDNPSEGNGGSRRGCCKPGGVIGVVGKWWPNAALPRVGGVIARWNKVEAKSRSPGLFDH